MCIPHVLSTRPCSMRNHRFCIVPHLLKPNHLYKLCNQCHCHWRYIMLKEPCIHEKTSNFSKKSFESFPFISSFICSVHPSVKHYINADCSCIQLPCVLFCFVWFIITIKYVYVLDKMESKTNVLIK